MYNITLQNILLYTLRFKIMEVCTRYTNRYIFRNTVESTVLLSVMCAQFSILLIFKSIIESVV